MAELEELPSSTSTSMRLITRQATMTRDPGHAISTIKICSTSVEELRTSHSSSITEISLNAEMMVAQEEGCEPCPTTKWMCMRGEDMLASTIIESITPTTASPRFESVTAR